MELQSCCFFEFLIFLLLRCQIIDRAMYPLMVIPAFYGHCTLQQSFWFAVFPKQYITFNSMQYVVMKRKKDDMDLFAEETHTDTGNVKLLFLHDESVIKQGTV